MSPALINPRKSQALSSMSNQAALERARSARMLKLKSLDFQEVRVGLISDAEAYNAGMELAAQQDQFDEHIIDGEMNGGDDDDEENAAMMSGKLQGWEERKQYYRKLVVDGNVTALQEALERQQAKLERAKAKKKPEVYLSYKYAKTEWTKRAIELAKVCRMMHEKKMTSELKSMKLRLLGPPRTLSGALGASLGQLFGAGGAKTAPPQRTGQLLK
ncbi:hypothetical protein AB1Y20_012259 [Prymnesium parvum]|uniref:Pre-mRNA-splicing factor SYF2 n=1 Tax=Prymnesium parvum TaxID=97485 RepID=A0AB34IMZ9_PRYPA